jgi:NodT family efflux transporter outer membrane factor (OMF) lipoprotein
VVAGEGPTFRRPRLVPLAAAAIAALVLLSPGCLKVPPYQVPATTTIVPQSYKEEPPKGWKQAQPNDGEIRGKWWEIFGDAALNALEEQVNISNQNVLQAEANYRQATAAVRIARSALFPLVTGSPSVTGSQTSQRLATAPGSISPVGIYNIPVGASYSVDLWGSIHRTVAASANTAQATEAQLENARLLYQSELAQDYFQLHGTDGDIALLQATVKSYQEFLVLTQNRYQGGVASDADVAQAETQLYTTQAELVDLEVQRTQLEHAMAILIGKPPAELAIPREPIKSPLPQIPVGLPSALLERRPDIAEAERQAAAANQQIGIAMAAFYPALTLAATAGVESSSFINWITWPSRFWTIGPQLAQTLFDAGKRTATLEQAKAGYDATAANYRQTVLTAFQQVEDNLSALRVLEDESSVLDQAVKSATRSVTVSEAQYKGGTVTYLAVITVQTILLQDQRSAVDLQTRRMTASVLLIQALGGGWNVSTLPTVQDVGMK